MARTLSDLDGRSFDVVVVGAGAVGASAAQNLAARGYDVLLAEKGDFASGTTSRSSRLLYCGVAHLSPDYPVWKFALHPRDLVRRLWMARLAMTSRAQLVSTMPERLRPYTFFFPVYENGRYPGWKVDLGFRALGVLGGGKVSLNYRRIPVEEAARRYGMVRLLAAREDLRSVAAYTEYQYDWAERICIDTVLDAERLGAEVRNYARVKRLAPRPGPSWEVEIEDPDEPGQRARVTGRMLVNTAGPWVDRVNAAIGRPSRKHLVGIKGINVVVKLPPECEGYGLETISSIGQPYYCMPWGKYHFFGPTETVFEGDPDDVRVEPAEIDYILGEANRLFPTLSLGRSDVVYSWAGVRPRTSSEDAEGVKALTIHDLASEGMPNAIALTGAPIMIHRHAGSQIADRVGQSVTPRRRPQSLSHAARLFPEDAGSAPLDNEHPEIRVADLRHAAAHEHVRSLVDLLFRRTPLGWTASMGLGPARRAAESVADILGWDGQRVDLEVARYRDFVAKHFEPAALGSEAARGAGRIEPATPSGAGGRR